MTYRAFGKLLVILSWALVASQVHATPVHANPPALSLDWPPKLELDHTLVQTSLYTRHFNPDPEHTNHQELIGLEFHTRMTGWPVAPISRIPSRRTPSISTSAGSFPSGISLMTRRCAPS
ncbi:hypothetical protein A8U91_04072 [Halomonas elongata]|uniref:Uncharacterized protein n=1 Tax=Halomonas elongata TaxID=2746 RepID=A0A1B8NYG1_HALEL|nr:hypothetical protein [Halomonas elongata]OBX35008.1 hypothetical protein A8U91_04072 [Halomonas elongata]